LKRKKFKESYVEQSYLRRKQIEAKIGLSCSTIYAMMARGDFPKPIKIGRRAVGWPEKEVNAWLDAKFAERKASND